MKKVFLSVLIPCYNEEANLKQGVLEEVADYLKKQKFSWEVVISDDGSTDKSRSLVKAFLKGRPSFRLLENKHGGKAFALRSAIKEAGGEIILTTDMDQSTPIKELAKLLPWFEKGYQVVIGSRGLLRKGAPWHRKMMALGFRIVRGAFLLWKINDTQCGFKAYRASVIKKIFPRLGLFERVGETKGWRVSAFDVEVLFMAQKWDYKIKEVLVDWRDRDVSTTKAQNFLNESQKMASEVLRVRFSDWQGKYDHKD
jgi:dolichyl-phosphate beta-glucosyltransferase